MQPSDALDAEGSAPIERSASQRLRLHPTATLGSTLSRPATVAGIVPPSAALAEDPRTVQAATALQAAQWRRQ